MKKLFCFIALVFACVMLQAEVRKYYIGDIEVCPDDYFAVEQGLIGSTMNYNSGDTVIWRMEKNIYARIDTVSEPGHVLVVLRPQYEIDELNAYFKKYRTESAVVKVGRPFPAFELARYAGGTPFTSDSIAQKVAVLNFWATYCGPCLRELMSDAIPSVVSEFAHRDDFVFIPVSRDNSIDDLDTFFNERHDFDWLKTTTLYDEANKFGQMLNESVPLTVVVGKDGTVLLNESGSFINEDDLARLRDCISNALSLEPCLTGDK